MKSLVILALASISVVMMGQNTPGSMELSVTTVSNNAGFSPKHILAIWVEDGSGNFVKTLKLRADKRKQYLYSWNDASGGNTTDATTGATLSSHGTHSVTWNCTGTDGSVVTDGSYSVKVEYTSEHKQGPLTTIEFTKAADAVSFTPANETYFTDMDLVFNPESATGVRESVQTYQLNAYPVPAHDHLRIDLNLATENVVNIAVFSADMKLVKQIYTGNLSAGNHDFTWNLAGKTVPGTYILLIKGDNLLSARRIIVE